MHNIAVIGAGRIGRIHAGNANSDPRIVLKYIVDPEVSAAEQLAAATGAGVAKLADVLVDSSVKGIVVASSTDTHLEFSMAAIKAGKAVFCEKPLDLDLQKARAAASSFGADSARLFLGFNRRFDSNFQELHELIGSGQMGALETLHIISHDPSPPPIDYVRISGGMFKDMTIHDFDMARWMLGEDPVEVYAAATSVVDPAIGEAGDVDTAKLLLRTGSGKICVISNSRRSGYGYDQRIEAFCAKGLLRAGNVYSSTVEAWSEGGSQSAALQNFFLDRYAGAYRSEMTHFADILDGAQPLVGYHDGIAALAIAEAALESHLRSEAVPICY
ncbi:inositol 2-dehydrogenase [Sphingomonas sp. RB56-2]|uniref:Inositol 2-dehydrogenase n=1 Tax=Sphingomonas brevis TaxID=2908206 RepID=A0ABT0S8Q5_9SPHN|nr:inositol 2-dehydrogenase [Sphingomonas brevis]MCL6740800.1 inositol 2-dehydrogenase [Sphingomonas brevis]